MPAPLRSSESSHGRLGGRRFAEFEIFEKDVSDDGVRRRYGVVGKGATPNLARS